MQQGETSGEEKGLKGFHQPGRTPTGFHVQLKTFSNRAFASSSVTFPEVRGAKHSTETSLARAMASAFAML